MQEVEIKIDPSNYGCSEARVVAVSAAQGQTFQHGDTLIEFECDKASFEVSMPGKGVILEVLVSQNDVVTEKTTVLKLSLEQVSSSKVETAFGNSLEPLRAAFPKILRDSTSIKEACKCLDNGLVLRRATTQDANQIWELWQVSYSRSIGDSSFVKPRRDVDRDWFAEQIESGEESFWVGSMGEDPTIIGCCKTYTVKRNPTANYVIIGLFVQHPEVDWSPGRQLISATIKDCQSPDLPILAYTNPRNLPAIRLLQHLGFNQTGTIGAFSDGSETMLVFEYERQCLA